MYCGSRKISIWSIKRYKVYRAIAMITSPGCSLSSTLDITLTEFKSCFGPQSVHASSPKCKSAKSAILKGEPCVIWRLSPGVVRRATGRRSPRRFSERTVEMSGKRRRKQETDDMILVLVIIGRGKSSRSINYEKLSRMTILSLNLFELHWFLFIYDV